MAGSVRCLMKLNFGLLTKNVTRSIVLNQTRYLYGEQNLGMVAYNAARNVYKKKFLNLEDSFRERIKCYVENDASGMIFTEDLKVILHLVEKTPEDKELMIKMLEKFNSQSEDLRFTTFTFGPIVMRAFYRLDEPDLAVKMFNDPAFSTFFNQLSSYQILLDLLYRNKRYTVMREVYTSITGRLTNGKVHPRNALILVTAACYKENTPESFEYATNLWHDLNKRAYTMVRRVLMYLAALAINQGQPHMALEVLITTKDPRYIALRCLKIMAYCDMNRTDDVIPFFRSSLEQDDPTLKKEMYFKDTIERVEAMIERSNVGADAEIRKLLQLIKTGDFVQETTLDDHLNEEIIMVQRIFPKNREDHQNTPIIHRPGLRDLI